MSVRKLNWYESKDDATLIRTNRWNLQLAKPVASGGAEPTYNLIWKSQALAPRTSISWKVQYALGWTAQVPNDGVSISIEGEWQACNKGQSFDIDNMGYWQPSSKPVSAERKGWLNVGNINYAYPGVLGIHIVIGVLNTVTGEYEPIFVDTSVLPPGSSGWYQPQETVSWWLEASDLTGSVFHGTKGESTTQDFSNPSDRATNTYEWSTSYLFAPPSPPKPTEPAESPEIKHWVVSPGKPPQSRALAPPPSALLPRLSLGGKAPMALQLDPARWIVTFASPMAAVALAAVAASLYGKLKDKFRKLEISIEGTDGTKLRVAYESGNGNTPGAIAFLGAAGDPVDTIDEALKQMLASGTIAAGETWKISQDIYSSILASATSSSNSITSSTVVDRDIAQTAEPITSNNASSGHYQQQQQKQSNGATSVPTTVSLSKSLTSPLAIVKQPVEYISQTAEPSTSDNASSGFHQQDQQSNGNTIIPTHFNEANPNGVKLVAA